MTDTGPDFLRYVCDMQQKKVKKNNQAKNPRSLPVVAGKVSKVGGVTLLGIG